MSRRRTAQEVPHILHEAARDLANELTVPDICRKLEIAQTTYYRWRQQYAPDQVDTDRRCRELELEVDLLKRLVAECDRRGLVVDCHAHARRWDKPRSPAH